jgi:hypothetical protein
MLKRHPFRFSREVLLGIGALTVPSRTVILFFSWFLIPFI